MRPLASAGPLPPAIPSPGPAGRTSRASRFVRFLKSHPILCLLLLSPGLPEYLSSSSSITLLITVPPVFFLFLAANLGMYGPGVLLIREAKVRWGKGWTSVILLGAAYAILEEGVALSTMFYSKAAPVGVLGYYGHYLGVNWVWLPGIFMVHIVVSIALPILLLDLALPETRGRSLLSERALRWAVGILAVDIAALALFATAVYHYFYGIPILLVCFTVMGLLILGARHLPQGWLYPTAARPTASPRAFAFLGLLLFPSELLVAAFSAQADLFPPAAILLILFAFTLLFAWGRTHLGRTANEAQLVAFAGGVLAPIAFFGLLAALPVPVVLALDLLLAYFLYRLWKSYGATSSSLGPAAPPLPPVPAGASWELRF